MFNTETSIVHLEELQLSFKENEASYYNGKDWMKNAYQLVLHVVQWLNLLTGLVQYSCCQVTWEEVTCINTNIYKNLLTPEVTQLKVYIWCFYVSNKKNFKKTITQILSSKRIGAKILVVTRNEHITKQILQLLWKRWPLMSCCVWHGKG